MKITVKIEMNLNHAQALVAVMKRLEPQDFDELQVRRVILEELGDQDELELEKQDQEIMQKLRKK